MKKIFATILLVFYAISAHGADIPQLKLKPVSKSDQPKQVSGASAQLGGAPSDVTINFYKAVNSGNTQIAELLLQQGADINCRNCGGLPALTRVQAVYGNMPAPLRVWLISHGANPNVSDEKGLTPLMDALMRGQNPFWSHTHDVFYLLEHGADPSLKDIHGFGAMHYLTAKTPVAAVAIGNSQTPDQKLLWDMNEAFEKTLNKLIRSGANVNDIAVNGFTPLMNASMACNANVLKLLVGAGAEPFRRNMKGDTALSLALKQAVQSPIPGAEQRCNDAVLYLQGLSVADRN